MHAEDAVHRKTSSVREELRRISIELYPTGIQRLTHEGKKCADDEGDCGKNVSFAKDVLAIFVHFIITVIIVCEKK